MLEHYFITAINQVRIAFCNKSWSYVARVITGNALLPVVLQQKETNGWRPSPGPSMTTPGRRSPSSPARARKRYRRHPCLWPVCSDLWITATVDMSSEVSLRNSLQYTYLHWHLLHARRWFSELWEVYNSWMVTKPETGFKCSSLTFPWSVSFRQTRLWNVN